MERFIDPKVVEEMEKDKHVKSEQKDGVWISKYNNPNCFLNRLTLFGHGITKEESLMDLHDSIIDFDKLYFLE